MLNSFPLEDSCQSQILVEKIIKSNGNTILKHYIKGPLLGKGGFARVYKLTCTETSQIVAGKIISKTSIQKPRSRQKLMSEIKIHRSLHHTNIVNFYNFFEDEEFLYIILELCQNLTLSDLLKRRKRLTELEVQCFMLQLISGIRYLHSCRVLHRDIKLGNVFIDENMEVKIGDFGLAAKLEYEGERKRTVCGTPNYMAPEIIEGKFGHSYECDIWSLGVVMYTLLIGKPPFETKDVKTTYRRIRLNLYNFPEKVPISDSAKSLIQDILVVDYLKRPGFDQILDHDFFNKNLIPKSLPSTVLAIPPSSGYIKQFESRGRAKNKDFSGLRSSTQGNTPTNDTPTLSNNRPRSREPEKPLLNEKKNKVFGSALESPAENEPDVWVKTWIENQKYGIAYVLSNQCVGMLFNDKTKIIVSPNSQHAEYISNQKNGEKTTSFDLNEYPQELYKKVMLLKLHKKQLNFKESDQKNKEIRVYLKNSVRTAHATLFRLSNKTVQIWFNDHSELFFENKNKFTTYIRKNGEKVSFPLITALEIGSKDMVKRLKYSKDVLLNMLKGGDLK